MTLQADWIDLTDGEKTVLSRIGFDPTLGSSRGTPVTDRERESWLSLRRFRLASQASWTKEFGWPWTLTKRGHEVLAEGHRRGGGCCEHAITLPCVCVYKSYCPDHSSGGGICHGSHD